MRQLDGQVAVITGASIDSAQRVVNRTVEESTRAFGAPFSRTDGSPR